MRTNIRQRDVSFYVQDGHLVRKVTGARGDGRSYCHRCTERNFETLAHAVEETPANGEGTTAELIVQQEDLPFTQANVAMEFLKERGVVDVRHRQCYPATGNAYLDAMIEYHALAEEAESDGED